MIPLNTELAMNRCFNPMTFWIKKFPINDKIIAPANDLVPPIIQFHIVSDNAPKLMTIDGFNEKAMKNK